MGRIAGAPDGQVFAVPWDPRNGTCFYAICKRSTVVILNPGVTGVRTNRAEYSQIIRIASSVAR
jgi:hypothetical protein